MNTSKISIITDPQERLKLLITYSNAMEVDYRISPEKYYRSGMEMVRQANVYHQEGSLENAYVLYLKFMTLFLEKIRKHPDFKSVPTRLKSLNQEKLREILPKAEKLKQELLHQYEEEYKMFLAEQKSLEKPPPAPRKTDKTRPAVYPDYSGYINVDQPTKLDQICYPESPEPVESSSKTPIPAATPTPSAPCFDRSVKPSRLTLNREGLRKVKTPDKIMQVFQLRAMKNTGMNIETCGILAGKLASDELIITHLIIPEQKGTPDSCTTLNEEAIFDYQDQLNLITVGWIHTHPTQTAFLSSVDLHTHCPYQLLMPEAIAIVCAPKYNENKCFILTPKYGLNFIANCRQTGFHPHPTDPPLFQEAEHVVIVKDAPLDVLDLRKDKPVC